MVSPQIVNFHFLEFRFFALADASTVCCGTQVYQLGYLNSEAIHFEFRCAQTWSFSVIAPLEFAISFDWGLSAELVGRLNLRHGSEAISLTLPNVSLPLRFSLCPLLCISFLFLLYFSLCFSLCFPIRFLLCFSLAIWIEIGQEIESFVCDYLYRFFRHRKHRLCRIV